MKQLPSKNKLCMSGNGRVARPRRAPMLWKERQEEMGRFYGQRKEAGLYSQCKGKPMEGFQQHDLVYFLTSYIETFGTREMQIKSIRYYLTPKVAKEN